MFPFKDVRRAAPRYSLRDLPTGSAAQAAGLTRVSPLALRPRLAAGVLLADRRLDDNSMIGMLRQLLEWSEQVIRNGIQPRALVS
jgi:hypothetical protein